MSQVDYLHFFNNTLWDFFQFIFIYFIICIVFVQVYYEVFRLRLLSYKNLNNVLQKKNYFLNENINLFNVFFNFILSICNFLKLNQKLCKCFYE